MFLKSLLNSLNISFKKHSTNFWVKFSLLESLHYLQIYHQFDNQAGASVISCSCIQKKIQQNVTTNLPNFFSPPFQIPAFYVW